MHRTRFLSGAIAVAATSLLASACTTSGSDSSGSTGAGGAASGGTVKVGVTSDVTSFDPARGTAASDYMVTGLLYQPLIGQDDGGKFVPGLAAKWEQTPTSTTFTLKDGLTCSDGKDLTPAQVAASLERYRATSASATLTFGAANTGKKTTITGDDKAGTVTIKTATPWGEVLNGLSGTAAGIVCEPGIKAGDKKLATGAVKGAATGAYEMVKAARGSSYELKLRKGYDAFAQYGSLSTTGRPADVLKLQVVKNESTIANQLSTGALDFASFTGPDAARFAKNDKYALTQAPFIRNFIAFNQRSGHPGADAKVRKAVAQAVDAKAFNKVFGGAGQEMTSYVDAKSACVSTDASLLTKTDKAAAAKTLKGVKIKLEGSNAVAQGAGNTYVQEALRAAGADVKLSNADNATWGTDILGNQGDWDVTVFPLISGSLARGGTYFVGDSPAKGLNFGGADNKKFLASYVAATTATDQNTKCSAWQKAQEAILKANDVVPLATVNLNYVARKGIAVTAPAGALSLSSLRVTG
ncbi:ABC transporter substrate-binding protein [Streptomyces endophyticus]|uniref:ABC transporter substrate-binding protein n=1 Tax=Streptomyces endophyticus TaxID=714166 RepID=A0ABU6FA26_9ACTN|nr:ABC transporter substrate-binding protein [Streptomyces endophyticus]MEB8340788.1 ABC transporter substrate-binding protein [Streptomyces endophyticus]